MVCVIPGILPATIIVAPNSPQASGKHKTKPFTIPEERYLLIPRVNRTKIELQKPAVTYIPTNITGIIFHLLLLYNLS